MYIWYSRQFTQDSFSSLRPRTEAVRISTRTKKKIRRISLGKARKFFTFCKWREYPAERQRH